MGHVRESRLQIVNAQAANAGAWKKQRTRAVWRRLARKKVWTGLYSHRRPVLIAKSENLFLTNNCGLQHTNIADWQERRCSTGEVGRQSWMLRKRGRSLGQGRRWGSSSSSSSLTWSVVTIIIIMTKDDCQGDKLEADIRGEDDGSEEPRRKTSFIEQLGSMLKNILWSSTDQISISAKIAQKSKFISQKWPPT